MQLTYTTYAWIDPQSMPIESIKDGTRVPLLSPCAPGEDGWFERQGYTNIGTAEVTLTLHINDKIVMDQINGLNAQLETVRAESQQKENAIMAQISKLQALTMG